MSIERCRTAWAATSVARSQAAARGGQLAAEIIAIGGCDADEVLPVRQPDAAALAELPPAFDPHGTLTAGNSAPLVDGAVAVALADPGWAAANDLTALASLEAVALRTAAPDDLTAAARSAAQTVTGGAAIAVDAIELPEPSAAVAVSLQRTLGVDPDVVNRWGGSLAMGDLPGASDLRALVTLVHQLVRDDLTGGLVVGGGLGMGGAALLVRR